MALTTMKIDTTFFQDPAFEALHDNNVKIDPVTPGRSNPFLPVQPDPSLNNGPQTALPPVVTNNTTQITNKTAVLNGAVNSTTTPTAVYFEYGTSAMLVKPTQTPNAVQSLVSTFIVKISGLTPQTTYYYRAAARIGGAVVYGDINSFTTTK